MRRVKRFFVVAFWIILAPYRFIKALDEFFEAHIVHGITTGGA